MKKILIVFALAFIIIISMGIASAANVTVCCEKTSSGFYCQDVPADQCASGAKQAPTSCKSTSYCRPGTCFDSNEGTCLDNTPQNVCNMKKGIWSAQSVPQCDLGCCVLGDQAAFVTLTRCKKLSSFLGLETNYKNDIKNEVACIMSVQGQEKGACVYESDLQKKCRFTTRTDCSSGNSSSKGQFFKDKLCSAEELGTVCGPSTKTVCAPGKEEVYYVDTCGNVANIYDSRKFNDKNYWSDVKDKTESCGANSANVKSGEAAECGNCNYLLGSFCRDESAASTKATYGDYVCADLNCYKTSNGKDYKHGESWCVNTDKGKTGVGNNAVGSRFYKHICMNGEEVLEQCAEYRQHECIEDSITTSVGKFSQAACRVNRWQDCIMQSEKDSCENTDKRDCLWLATGRCVPKNSPGLKFWEEDAAKTCGQASVTCTATYEKGIGQDKEWHGDCVSKNGDISQGWLAQVSQACYAMGDCTSDMTPDGKINWLGVKGY